MFLLYILQTVPALKPGSGLDALVDGVRVLVEVDGALERQGTDQAEQVAESQDQLLVKFGFSVGDFKFIKDLCRRRLF